MGEVYKRQDRCRLTTEDLEVAEDGEVWIKTARKKTKIDYEEMCIRDRARGREFEKMAGQPGCL